MKCSLGISNFLEEISSLSHSFVFLCLFALFTEEGFLISPCCSLELCIQMDISFLFSLVFHFSSFHSCFKASSDNHFAFLHFFFLVMVLIAVSCTMPWTSVHHSSDTLSIRSSPLNLYLTSTAAAAAAKSLQSCPTLRSHRRQHTRLHSPWDFPVYNHKGFDLCHTW